MDESFRNILGRRSIRNYDQASVSDEIIKKIVTAASYAPSGKNGQPWRFIILKDRKTIQRISKLTIYSRFMETAPCAIAIYLDKGESYDEKKILWPSEQLFRTCFLQLMSRDIPAVGLVKS